MWQCKRGSGKVKEASKGDIPHLHVRGKGFLTQRRIGRNGGSTSRREKDSMEGE